MFEKRDHEEAVDRNRANNIVTCVGMIWKLCAFLGKELLVFYCVGLGLNTNNKNIIDNIYLL